MPAGLAQVGPMAGALDVQCPVEVVVREVRGGVQMSGRLKGKCKTCRGSVVLVEGGAWVHAGFGWFTCLGIRFDRARTAASRQADYALAGPSKGGR
ncbi:hypothetical protein PBI_MELONS_69 [Arthrobacter phage Melons]|uniref:Uncharacterized protein n=1 Tax=Arthrobacter phage Melons TaxID=2419962 RepID=A0A3G2KI04_9CAUD|nr:hypothetical protein PBI_MELONS_69 [Arthrobacter phage Melons]